MTPYKGILKIVCNAKKGCFKGLRDNMKPECTACPEGVTQILDLEGKVLFETKALENRRPEKQTKRARPAKTNPPH